MNVPRILFTGT